MSKKTRVAINGFGRIGKIAARIILEKKPDLELVAINGAGGVEEVLQHLKYDSVYGRMPFFAKVDSENLVVNRDGEELKIQVSSEMDPATLPWKELGVDVVLDCTGVFKDVPGAGKHLQAGAGKVIISAPAKDEEIPMVVLGVNDVEAIEKMKDGVNIISNASCTTNCMAPALMVLDNTFEIENIVGLTVHAYTASQNLQDGPSRKNLRIGRAAAMNIIPTSTGAAKATEIVLPQVKGRVELSAARIPTITGSMVYTVINFDREVSKDEVNNALKKAAEGELKGILEYSEEELVSTDIIGNSHSCIVDGLLTEVLGKTAKIVLWYDNEWGYSNRLVELVERVV